MRCFSLDNLPLLQSVAMLRNITTFHTLATAAVERTAGASGGDQKITYNVIKNRLSDLLYKITSQKFEDPADGEETVKCALGPANLSLMPFSCAAGRFCSAWPPWTAPI